MKLAKYLILCIFGIFLISSASAMVLYGAWQNGATSLTITSGNSANFTIDYGSMNPSPYINAKLYNSNDSAVWQKYYNNLNGNFISDMIPSSSLPSGNYQLILNGNDAANNPYTQTLSLTVNPAVIPPVNSTDTIPPVVILNSPADNITSNSSLITFNGTVSDNVGVSNVTLYIDNGITNQTNFSGLNNTNYFFTFNLSNGIHSWNYHACDTSGNCAFSSVNRIITINTSSTNSTNSTDTIAPQIQFVTNTPSNNSHLSQNSIPVNVTASDSGSGLKNIIVYLYDSSRNLINIFGPVSYSPFAVNMTDLNSGTYYINATAYDNAGNSNSTVITISLSNSNNNGNSGNNNYSYIDVYQNQYLQQLNRTNQKINLTGETVNSNSSLEFAFLLFEILLVLVIIGIIIFVFAKRKFRNQ
jgi:hypothetical protein